MNNHVKGLNHIYLQEFPVGRRQCLTELARTHVDVLFISEWCDCWRFVPSVVNQVLQIESSLDLDGALFTCLQTVNLVRLTYICVCADFKQTLDQARLACH